MANHRSPKILCLSTQWKILIFMIFYPDFFLHSFAQATIFEISGSENLLQSRGEKFIVYPGDLIELRCAVRNVTSNSLTLKWKFILANSSEIDILKDNRQKHQKIKSNHTLALESAVKLPEDAKVSRVSCLLINSSKEVDRETVDLFYSMQRPDELTTFCSSDDAVKVPGHFSTMSGSIRCPTESERPRIVLKRIPSMIRNAAWFPQDVSNREILLDDAVNGFYLTCFHHKKPFFHFKVNDKPIVTRGIEESRLINPACYNTTLFVPQIFELGSFSYVCNSEEDSKKFLKTDDIDSVNVDVSIIGIKNDPGNIMKILSPADQDFIFFVHQALQSIICNDYGSSNGPAYGLGSGVLILVIVIAVTSIYRQSKRIGRLKKQIQRLRENLPEHLEAQETVV